MKLRDFIVSEAVVPDLAAGDRDGVIRELVTSLAGAGAVSPEAVDEVVAALVKREMKLTKAEQELTERERQVVRLRFGLEDGQVRTLEEVGREFGVTRERVRQIEAKTLAKLRHPMRSQRLKEFLEEE